MLRDLRLWIPASLRKEEFLWWFSITLRTFEGLYSGDHSGTLSYAYATESWCVVFLQLWGFGLFSERPLLPANERQELCDFIGNLKWSSAAFLIQTPKRPPIHPNNSLLLQGVFSADGTIFTIKLRMKQQSGQVKNPNFSLVQSVLIKILQV